MPNTTITLLWISLLFFTFIITIIEIQNAMKHFVEPLLVFDIFEGLLVGCLLVQHIFFLGLFIDLFIKCCKLCIISEFKHNLLKFSWLCYIFNVIISTVVCKIVATVFFFIFYCVSVFFVLFISFIVFVCNTYWLFFFIFFWHFFIHFVLEIYYSLCFLIIINDTSKPINILSRSLNEKYAQRKWL